MKVFLILIALDLAAWTYGNSLYGFDPFSTRAIAAWASHLLPSAQSLSQAAHLTVEQVRDGVAKAEHALDR